jgi:dsRNA-specific ribonuclease
LAIIAAVQKSSGTLAAQSFIKHFILSYLIDKDINELWDIPKPWAMLTDIMNQRGETFEPRLLRESGRNSLLSVFVVGLYDSKKQLIGTGKEAV